MSKEAGIFAELSIRGFPAPMIELMEKHGLTAILDSIHQIRGYTYLASMETTQVPELPIVTIDGNKGVFGFVAALADWSEQEQRPLVLVIGGEKYAVDQGLKLLLSYPSATVITLDLYTRYGSFTNLSVDEIRQAAKKGVIIGLRTRAEWLRSYLQNRVDMIDVVSPDDIDYFYTASTYLHHDGIFRVSGARNEPEARNLLHWLTIRQNGSGLFRFIEPYPTASLPYPPLSGHYDLGDAESRRFAITAEIVREG